MTGTAGLERAYRRLLAWYPQPFRSEQEQEMLAVLMASAREGQRRPGLAESADLIRGALRMRLRPARSESAHHGWTDALAVFSLVAPLFLVMADILEVALPYRLPGSFLRFISHREMGGLSLVSSAGFDIAVGCQVIIAVLVLLGLRRTALIPTVASIPVLYWVQASYVFPVPLELLGISVCILEAAALIASPGPGRGRQVVHWGHGVVLLLAAAAVQVSTPVYGSLSVPFWSQFDASRPDHLVYLVVTVILVAVAAALAVIVRVGGYFLLLLATMLYPYAIHVVATATGAPFFMFAYGQSPGQLVLLYLPPLLLACLAMIGAATPRRLRIVLSSGPDQPRLT